MTTLADFSFFLMLSLFMTHEIDAVKQREWRMLPVLNRLDDEAGFWWFTALHVPMFLLFFWYFNAVGFRIGLSAFAVIHAGLHWILRKHPNYEFNNLLSDTLVRGAAIAGALYLIAQFA